MNYAGKFDAALSLDRQGFGSPDHVDSFTARSFAAKSFTAKAHGHVPDGAVVVADPNLIFHGDFKRTGLDLVLSHDGHEFVVHDYFRGDKRAAIASPDGAHLTGDIVSALTGYVQYAQAAPGAAAASPSPSALSPRQPPRHGRKRIAAHGASCRLTTMPPPTPAGP